jgi:hypothetical protein
MQILSELFIALAAIVLLLFVSNAFLGQDALPTTSAAAAPVQGRVNVTPQDRINAVFGQFVCQSASKFDPRSAANFDPLVRRVLAVALAPSELVGVAETARARVVG